METIWLIPVHVRPVVSFEGLGNGEVKDPTTGLDRFNLTDIGDVLFRQFTAIGAEIVFKGVELPFPWEIVFKINKEPKASLKGLKVGPSTYRSIFKLIFFEGDDVYTIIKDCLDEIGRDVLDSPYWDDPTWQQFQKVYKLQRDKVIGTNAETIKKL